MESITQPQTPAIGPAPGLSLASRSLALFARPTQAWTGLERRGQWWFPLVVTIVVVMAGMALTYERAVVPMTLERLQRQVESGQVPPDVLSRFEGQMRSPFAMGVNVGSTLLIIPLMTLATALLPWLAVGFVLGNRFRYRDAFVVTAWAGMIGLPAQILTYALAWTNQTMNNLHVGFGVLLPVEDPPSKLMVGLGTFLDHGIGPLSLWYVAVLAVGAAALSGAPRRRVLLAVGGLWLAVILVISVVAALFAPGA